MENLWPISDPSHHEATRGASGAEHRTLSTTQGTSIHGTSSSLGEVIMKCRCMKAVLLRISDNEMSLYNNEILYRLWDAIAWSQCFNQDGLIPLDTGSVTEGIKSIYEMPLYEVINIGGISYCGNQSPSMKCPCMKSLILGESLTAGIKSIYEMPLYEVINIGGISYCGNQSPSMKCPCMKSLLLGEFVTAEIKVHQWNVIVWSQCYLGNLLLQESKSLVWSQCYWGIKSQDYEVPLY